jgi:hypothetical protein
MSANWSFVGLEIDFRILDSLTNEMMAYLDMFHV